MGFFGKPKSEKEKIEIKKQAEDFLSILRQTHSADVAYCIIYLMKERIKKNKNPQYKSEYLENFGCSNILIELDEIEKLLTSEEKKNLKAELKSEFPRICREGNFFRDDISCSEVLSNILMDSSDDEDDSDDDLDLSDVDLDLGEDDDDLDLGDDDSDDDLDLDLDDDDLDLGNIDLDLGEDDSNEKPSELEEKLEKLKKLFDKGLISESDYKKKERSPT